MLADTPLARSSFLLAFVAAAALSFVLTPLVRRVAAALGVLDTPDPRKIHVGAVPRWGGAAVGIALLVRHHHHAADKTQTYVTGCTQSIQDGISLTNEKDNQTYSIMSGSQSLKAGERMTLKGVVVATDGSRNPAFQIQSLIKDYGTCGPASASNRMSSSSKSLN